MNLTYETYINIDFYSEYYSPRPCSVKSMKTGNVWLSYNKLAEYCVRQNFNQENKP